MEFPKESVFIPCGHRCCCVRCAENLSEKTKECPICKQKITSLLKRVFD